ncbi:hypothetical protein KEM48_005192, partial [Puccinia striiformis f. sp. tritici PST-130]
MAAVFCVSSAVRWAMAGVEWVEAEGWGSESIHLEPIDTHQSECTLWLSLSPLDHPADHPASATNSYEQVDTTQGISHGHHARHQRCPGRLPIHLRSTLLSPFTKVEESFNLHAIHDFIHQPSLSAVAHAGDHLQFPGPLPRTFIGALLIGSIARALLPTLRFIGLVQSKFAEQILVRTILATLNSSSFVYFGLCTRFVSGISSLYLCSYSRPLNSISRFMQVARCPT